MAPASLLANWAAEIERFAPGLKAHRPSLGFAGAGLKALRRSAARIDLGDHQLRLAAPHAWIAETPWRLAVLDEAQAIKNPGAKQTRAVKKLKAARRLALTGTPVENRLGDLWSIFDFVNPGLLGSAKEFPASPSAWRTAARFLWAAARTGAARTFCGA